MTGGVRVAVAGGTGWVGRLVVEALLAGAGPADGPPEVLARSRGVDLVTGAGLRARLEGVDAVIDVTNVVTVRARTSEAFFGRVTANLLEASRQAGVRHLVGLSIVGVDTVDLGYYRGKRLQERLLLEPTRAGAPGTTVLRSTQFHEFAAQVLDRRGPVVAVPQMLTRPVAAREVASRLVELALGPAVGLAPPMAGPDERWTMPDMVRALARVRRDHRPVLAVRVPGRAGRALAGGALLPTATGPCGTTSFASWLDDPGRTR